MRDIMQEKSAGAVIFRKSGGKRLYLLLHYAAGHWDFVKGHIEKNESEKETAVREAKEEAGIADLAFISGFFEKVSYFYTREGRTIRKEAVFFLAETKTEPIVLSFEHTGFKWLAYEEAQKTITYENARNVLSKADAFLNSRHPKI